MRQYIRIFTISVITLFVSCEEVINTPGSEDFTPIIIVESLFTDEEKVQFVKLSQSVPVNYNGEVKPVSNATVFISDGSKIFTMLEKSVGSGIYETLGYVKGEVGKTYQLNIISDGKVYSATDKMEPVTPIVPIEYGSKNAGGFYEWSVPNNHSLSPGVTYQWNVEFLHLTGEKTSVTYYNFTGLETTSLFALNQMSQSVRFKTGTVITQKKYSLSADYYKFLKAIYTETDWRGGLYDVNPANAPTNLTNGAGGYFRASSVTTLIQEVK